jgi:hypothetical protein
MNDSWIDINEKMPEWKDFVLVATPHSVWIAKRVPNRWRSGGSCFSNGTRTMLNVTHWMPLPPRPYQ